MRFMGMYSFGLVRGYHAGESWKHYQNVFPRVPRSCDPLYFNYFIRTTASVKGSKVRKHTWYQQSRSSAALENHLLNRWRRTRSSESQIHHPPSGMSTLLDSCGSVEPSETSSGGLSCSYYDPLQVSTSYPDTTVVMLIYFQKQTVVRVRRTSWPVFLERKLKFPVQQ